MKSFRIALLAGLALASSASLSFGQGIITQWNFPSGFSTTSPAPSSGSGTAALIGGTSGTSAGGLTNAGSTEATAGSTAWNTSTYPGASAGSGTAGVSFTVSTASQSNLVFRFDHRASNTSSRYMQVQYTTDGSTWLNIGSVFESYAGGDTWYNNRTVDLSGISGANNNANFAMRIVSVFDPANNSSYTATTAGSTYGTSGTWRFDAVTLTAGYVWTGAGGNTEFGTAGNYSGGSAPGTTGTVLFGSAGGSNTTASTASGGNQLDQLVFKSGSPAYTISGSGTLTINAGILNDSSSLQTISAPVAFGLSNAIQSANNGTVRFNGNVNFTNYLSLTGAGTITLNGTTQGAISSSVTTTGNPASPTIRVGPNSTLSGIGTIGSSGTNNAIIVFANGAIRGGDPNGSSAEHVGNLTVNGNVTINTNGILKVEASRNTSTSQTGNTNADSSTLTVAGGADFNLVPGSGKIVIEIVNGPTALEFGETYTLQLATVQASSDLQLGGTAIGSSQTIAASNYELRSSSFGAFENVTLATNADGTALVLTFTPVPEPGMMLGIAAGALGIGGLIRRRLRKANVAPAIAA